jgi:hypothetical protein
MVGMQGLVAQGSYSSPAAFPAARGSGRAAQNRVAMEKPQHRTAGVALHLHSHTSQTARCMRHPRRTLARPPGGRMNPNQFFASQPTENLPA